MPSVDNNPLALHGHISYLEIPALNIPQSTAFFNKIFNWTIRQLEPTRAAFDDPAGNLIGRFVTCHQIAKTPGLLPYLYVTNIHDTVQKIQTNGGTIEKPIYPEGDLLIATFRDPAGNYLGIWQFASR